MDKVEHLSIIEYKYFQQRSKSDWVPNVDRNTRDFHMAVKYRRLKNTIEALKRPNDTWGF